MQVDIQKVLKTFTTDELHLNAFPRCYFYSFYSGVLRDKVYYITIMYIDPLPLCPLLVHLLSTWPHSCDQCSRHFLRISTTLLFHVTLNTKRRTKNGGGLGIRILFYQYLSLSFEYTPHNDHNYAHQHQSTDNSTNSSTNYGCITQINIRCKLLVIFYVHMFISLVPSSSSTKESLQSKIFMWASYIKWKTVSSKVPYSVPYIETAQQHYKSNFNYTTVALKCNKVWFTACF